MNGSTPLYQADLKGPAAIVIVSLLTPAPSEAVANEFDHYMDEGGAAVEKVVQ